MPQIQIDDQVFHAAQRRAADDGYPTVEAYITDVVVHDLASDGDNETPNLDDRFTPAVIADLERISAAAKSGGKTYTSEEVRQHFREKSRSFEENRSK